MSAFAEGLGEEWVGSGCTVLFILEYYENAGWPSGLRGEGVQEAEAGLNDDVRHSAILALVDLNTARAAQRREIGVFSSNGEPLDLPEETLRLARGPVDYRAR